MSAPAGPGGRIDIGAALSYGWNKFKQHSGPLIVCTLIVFLVQVLVTLVTLRVSSAGGQVVVRIIGTVVGLIMTRGLIRAALSVVNGHAPDAAQVFRFDNLGGYLVASVIIGVAQGVVALIGSLLLGAGGLIIGVVLAAVINTLFGFYGFAIVERDLDGISGLKASYELTKNAFGNVFLFWIVAGIVSAIGVIACFVGLLVTIPVAQVAQAHAYRQLAGRPVAP